MELPLNPVGDVNREWNKEYLCWVLKYKIDWLEHSLGRAQYLRPQP